MTLTAVDAGTDALHPVRAALLERAEARAATIRAAAEAEAAAALAAAEQEAADLLEQARARGVAEAEASLARELVVTRRVARRIVLQAQRTAYDELRRRAADAVRELLVDPDRTARLAAVAQARLGGDGAVERRPEGGLVTVSPEGRRVDASVRALVDRALAELDLDRLWSVR